MIYKETRLKTIDNSGANWVKCIDVLNKSKSRGAKPGDIVIISIQTKQTQKALKKGQLHKGVFLRSAFSHQRLTGTSIKFKDNGLLLITNKKVPLGSRIYGPISQELRWSTHTKIISMAKLII